MRADDACPPGRQVETDGLSEPHRSLAFLVVTLATTMAALDISIVNVALPSIARDLQVPAGAVVRLVTFYQLGVVTALLPLSSLGDRLGHRRVYITGLAVFTLASLLCGVMPRFYEVVAARVLQGLGAAGTMSVNIALVRFIYPRRMIGRGIANTALVVAVSSAAGPSLAALILSIANWRWLFLINLPVGLLALGLARKQLPETPRTSSPVDPVGIGFNIATLSLLVIGTSLFDGVERDRTAVACVLAAIALGALFYRDQRSKPSPILPVDLFRDASFTLAVATSICAFFAQSIAFISLAFLLEGEFARSATRTGFLIGVWPMSIAVMSFLAGRLPDRVAPGAVVATGLACLATGCVSLGLGKAPATDFDLACKIALSGFGFGLFQPATNRAIMESAPPHRSGGASGMLATARLLGQSMGAAAMSVMLASHGHHHLRTPLSVAACAAFAGATAHIIQLGSNRLFKGCDR